MNNGNTLLSDLAASIADGAAIDWEQVKSSSTSPPELALLSQMQTIARIGERRWSQLADQPTRKAPVGASGHRVAEGAVSPEAAIPFQRWGHLEILERIGGGGFGEVYRARDPKLEREVALKLLRGERAQAPGLDSSVLKEGRLLARLHHPNVATIHGVDQHEGRVGLWMEFVRGKTLEVLLQEQGPLGAREAVGIGLDLCRALAAVHGAGLVHGDIKAQNVIREEGGRIVLADFGLGREVSQDLKEPLQGGTPLYMAPELLREEPATVRSDIYALGVLLFRLLTGAYPVTGRSIEEVLQNLERGETKLLRDLRSDLPEGVIRVIEQALSRDPMQRFATTGELERALAHSLAAETSVWPVPLTGGRFLPTWLQYSILGALGIVALSVLLVLRVIPPFWETVPEQREWVFVADFENRTEVPNLDLLVRESLVLTLEQSRYLNIFPRSRAIRTLALMQMPKTTKFDPLVSRQVCKRENVAILISGEIAPAAEGYQILVRAADPGSDAAKAVIKIALGKKEDLYIAVDTLAAQLRNALGESRTQVEETKPLEHVTTSSFEALERFSRGREYYVQGKTQDALIMFKSAADLDPEFAMACEYLAQVHSVLGRKEEGLVWANRAYGLRDRVTERERYMIEALYHVLREEVEKALESYQAVTLLYPDDPDAHRIMATYLSWLRRLDEAIVTARRAVALDPKSTLTLGALVLLLAQANRNEEALQELRLAGRAETYDPYISTAEGLAWLGKGDLQRATRIFERLAADPNREIVGRVYLAQTMILQGELVKALEQLEGLQKRESEMKDQDRLYLCRSWLARLYRHLGRRTEALRPLESMASYPPSPSRIQPLRFAALSLAQMGKLKEAETVVVKLEALSKDFPSALTDGVAAHVRGELEWKAGRSAEAREYLESARSKWEDPLALWSLAGFWESQGDLNRALSLYERVLDLKGTVLRFECSDLWVLAHLQAGRCQSGLRNSRQAAAHYDEFLRLWGTGASDLPVVKQARQERQSLSHF